MLEAVLIGPNQDLSSQVQCLCTSSSGVFVYQSLPRYGGRYEIVRLLNLLNPQVVFLEVGTSSQALQTAKEIRAYSPKVPIVGFGRRCDSEEIIDLQEAGMGSIFLYPFTEEKLKKAVTEALDGSRKKASGTLLAFLPAKAGSGASTVALNLGGALAGVHRQKVLLIDADLHSGVQALLTRCDAEKTVADGLENAEGLDADIWSSLVIRTNGLDLLAAPANPKNIVRIFAPWDYFHLVAFARTLYDYVLVDLPEVIDDATEGAVKRADSVFVVCTPELASLSLARRRILEILSRDVEQHRLKIVLNRATHRGLQSKEFQRILGRHASVSLPNDYPRVCRAGLDGKLLTGNSKIARAFAEFANTVAEKKAVDVVRAAEHP